MRSEGVAEQKGSGRDVKAYGGTGKIGRDETGWGGLEGEKHKQGSEGGRKSVRVCERRGEAAAGRVERYR
jgi:hypothetical protein